MSNKLTNIIAILLLTFMFALALSSMVDDSATMDEVAHLPSGYSYLTQRDMRLNPEHPPLMKDLAAFPLLFIKGINFPSEIKDWKEDVNGQWGFGYHFLYKTGNPADLMIFWGRIPMVLVLILLGFYVFKWARELFGNKAGLLALFLFSFSPTFLAHGKLITTDVGAAAGIFIAVYYFIKTLENPNKRNIILAGISFGLAELCKFSVILLIPFFALISLIWWLVKLRNLKQTLKILILVFVIGYILIWPVYQYHVCNHPLERQLRDTEFLLSSFKYRTIADLVIWMTKKPILRAYAQYALGLLMAIQRTTGGHTTYFLGEVSAAGWKSYFPIVYLIKETLAFHILTLIALLYAAWQIKKPFWQDSKRRLIVWLKSHFPEFAMLTFIGIYWATSLVSDLNIGVRHLLPAFPFTMVLTAGVISQCLKQPFLRMKYLFLGVLISWQVFSIVQIYPHFLAYFNEIVKGPDKGYLYTVDSNLDWGQDLKRLTKWVDENLPAGRQVYVDYFGGGDAEYYLKEKYAPWRSTQDPKDFPKGNYLAVSATFLQAGRGMPIPGFEQVWGYYLWLNKYTPIIKIGHSIFVYYID